MSTELAKTFDPAAIEAKWYRHWEQNGCFRPSRPDAEPFTLVNPPPNVTGSLHIGHALDNTLQDVVVRYERLRGKDALWVVGTDHAGIATQMVVERNLASQGVKRTDMSREQFVEHIWEWKEQSGGTITRQLRRLGCSMDWSREQFTMDPHFTRAVVKVFVDLYNQGLIYRDKRLVNWDPALKTAISDLEVETREVQGHFWHLRYPLADGSGYISVATTRPETMLADMAVAVHPNDERYAALVASGAKVRLPITGREVPIVPDEHADPELGSGAVKITPGHDFNDFEVGKRAGFKPAEMLNMLDAEARVVQTADGRIPAELVGLDRFEARKRVVAMLDEAGLLERVEDRTIATPYGDRGGVVIEPWLTDQWYVDAETLAQAPMQAVRDGRIEIVPKTWEKTFFNWMENIQPWCVSRQLWWGHRIPAWYDDEGNAYVAETEDEAQQLAGNKALIRDPDVLDTWFSSALWPFATLGWPEASSPSPDGEGDHAQHGGGVRYKLPPKTNASVLRAKAMRRALSPAEAMLWRALKERPGDLKFRSQHPAGDYTLDFFCPAAALAIEVDGEAHERGNRVQRDAARDAQLSEWGVETLRIPAGEVFGNTEAVVSQIVTRAQERIPLHQPSAGPPPRQAGEDSLLARHYPNDLLISGFDILFFWDARMAMQGLHFMADVPWKRLYLHGLVRAADGQKMSKSKGNVVDPLGLIDTYGADALRFFMAAMESQGRDVKMDESRVEGYRNFATKLWNATRFCQANGIGASQTVAAPPATTAVNKWIIGEVVETADQLDKAMAELRFDAAANAIYHFTWDTFCDWYLELIKPVLSKSSPSSDGEGDQPQAGGGVTSAAQNTPPPPTAVPLPGGAGEDRETRAVAGWVLDQILVMLHPFMPFVTEELWHAQGARPYELILAQWPRPKAQPDPEAQAEVEWLIALTTALRGAKNELGIAPGAKLEAFLPEPSPNGRAIAERNAGVLDRLARLSAIRFEPAPAGAAMQVSVGSDLLVIPLEGVIDIAAEKTRLAKARDAALKERDSLAKRLENPAFVERAKPEAVEKARADHAHHAAEAEGLEAALARLG